MRGWQFEVTGNPARILGFDCATIRRLRDRRRIIRIARCAGVPTGGPSAYDGRMSIRVEFYGIPRQRAGIAATNIDVSSATIPLLDVFRQLGERFPKLARDCFDQHGLRDGYAANVNGERFVADALTPLADGSCLLILSADAGG